MPQSNLAAKPGPAPLSPIAWLYLGLLLLLTLMAYWTSLGFGFVWDDLPLIVDNELLRDPEGPFKIFFRNFWDVGGRNDTFRHFYRPMVTLSYWLNAQLGGLQPKGFHALNLGLHLACVAMAYRLLLQLLGQPVLAFTAGVFFALHPTHVENVTWISGRTDLLAAFFGLAALSAWRAADQGRRAWLLPASAFYLLALLSKEVAVFFPLAWLAFPLKPGGPWLQWDKRRRLGLALAGLALLAYLGLRLNVLGVLGSNNAFPGWAVFAPALGWVLFSYLRLAFAGFGLDPHYSDVQFKFMQGGAALAGWLLLALVLALALHLLRRGGLRARGVWLALLFLLPVLSLGSFGDVLYADRFLYLPSLGLGLLLALGADALAKRAWAGPHAREQGIFAASGVLGLLLLLQVGRTASVWASNVRLFEQASRSSSDSVLVWNNLCLAYSYEGRYLEAEQAGRRALALEPRHGYSLHNVGVAIRRQSRPEDALPYLATAVAVDPLDSLYTYNLAEALAAAGQTADAVGWYRRTLQLKPQNQEARHNLGYLLLAQGRLEAARPLLEAAAASVKDPGPALNSLGILAARQGRRADARAYFERALQAQPGMPEALKNLHQLEKEPR